MSIVKFTAQKLAPGKKGILPCDENGYYTMPIGALNVFNSVGQFYTMDGAKQLFEGSSSFMHRVANGYLKGEVGHPKRGNMTVDQYMARILTVEETNVCCHFKEVWLDDTFGKTHPELKSPNLVAIMAKVKPSGEKGAALKESFENPDENVAFSIRSLTKDVYVRGVTNRIIQQIITFDNVTAPGISHANMWSAPALESFEEQIITKRNVENFIQNHPELVATESTRELATEALGLFDGSRISTIPPLWAKW